MRGQARLLWRTLILVACITWAHSSRELLGVTTAGLMLAGGLVLWLASQYVAKKPWLNTLLVSVAIGLAAFGYTHLRGAQRMNEQIPVAWVGQTLNVQGTIHSIPTRTPYGVRFLFAPSQTQPNAQVQAAMNNGTLPAQIFMTWNDDDLPSTQLKAGQEWRVPASLRPLRATQNEDVFDAEQNWLAQHIRGAATVRVNKDTLKADYPTLITTHATPMSWLHNTRAAALQQIDAQLLAHDAPSAAVFKALTFGDQDAVHASQWALFQQTGITHLISISGLHITMLAALLAWCVNVLWRRSVTLCEWLPSAHAAQWAGLILALVYALFTGWALPAQRTVYMLALWLFLARIGVAHFGLRVVCWALWGVLLFDPFAVLSIGFWLSFGAVAWLMLAFGVVESSDKTPRQRVAIFVASQLAIGVTLLPATLYFFHQASLLGVLVNFVAIPLVSMVLVPLLLASSLVQFVFGWGGAMVWANTLLSWCINGLAAVSTWLPNNLWVQNIAWWQTVLMTALSVVLVWQAQQKRWLRVAACGAVWLGLGFLPSKQTPIAPGQIQVHVLDVGQGTAVLLQTATRNWLFDSGPRYANESDAGARTIVPYLRAHNVTRIDTLILSHNDADHTGGAASIARAMPVAQVLTSMSLESFTQLQVKTSDVQSCQTGQIFEFDGVRISMLSPDSALRDNPNMSDNSKSCIIRIDTNQGQWQSIMLTGDVDGLQEARLVVSQTGGVRNFAVDVLMMPHHGSASSSTAPFIEATHPKMVFAQAGYLNSFHHPHPNTIARYQAAGAVIEQTTQTGTMRFCIGCEKAGMVKWRDVGQRYWW
jgi:competence protein ComEC